MGLIILLAGMFYMMTVGRWLLSGLETRSEQPGRVTLRQMAEVYEVADCLHSVVVKPDSTLIGQTVSEAGMRTHFEVTLIAIRRKGRLLSSLMPVLSGTQIAAQDELLVYGTSEDVERLCGYTHLQLRGFAESRRDEIAQQFGVVEVMPRPDAEILGQSLKQARFRDRYKLSVIGMRRGVRPLPPSIRVPRSRWAIPCSYVAVGSTSKSFHSSMSW